MSMLMHAVNLRKVKKATNYQRGATLMIVLIVLTLGSMLMLWTTRNILLHQRMVRNIADHQRAMHVAEAMLRDAEMDILGDRADQKICSTSILDNIACRLSSAKSENLLAFQDKHDQLQAKLYIPEPDNKLANDNNGAWQELQTFFINNAGSINCISGICLQKTDGLSPTNPLETKAFWEDLDTLREMKKRAAYYGQYTGSNQDDVFVSDNPLLQTEGAMTDNNIHAWYWIEPLLYKGDETSHASSINMAPTPESGKGESSGVVYRVTALAEGLRPHTRAVIQRLVVSKYDTKIVDQENNDSLIAKKSTEDDFPLLAGCFSHINETVDRQDLSVSFGDCAFTVLRKNNAKSNNTLSKKFWIKWSLGNIRPHREAWWFEFRPLSGKSKYTYKWEGDCTAKDWFGGVNDNLCSKQFDQFGTYTTQVTITRKSDNKSFTKKISANICPPDQKEQCIP